MRAAIERVVWFIGFWTMFLVGWLPAWFYGTLLVIATVLCVPHVVSWARRRGWRRRDPWPWDMPDRETADDAKFWSPT